MRFTHALCLFLTIGLWLSPNLVGKATASAAPAAKADAHGDHPAEEFSIFPKKYDLGLWTIIVFVILFLILRKFAWGPILQGLVKREEDIEASIAEARKARAEAESMRAQFQQDMANAQLKVKELMDEARRDAEHAKSEIVAQGKAELASERDRLQRDIQTQTDQALQSLWSKAADLATELSATALRKQLDMTAHRRLIDEALTDIRKTRPTTNAS